MSTSEAESRPLSYAQRALLVAITAYKGLISPLFAGSCRYVPSCSEYARLAIIELTGPIIAAATRGVSTPGTS